MASQGEINQAGAVDSGWKSLNDLGGNRDYKRSDIMNTKRGIDPTTDRI